MKGLLFTYVLTYGGSLVSLFRPYYGLLIYICFAIIKPDALWFWSVPAGSYSRIIAISLLIGWGLNGFGDWRFGRAKGIVVCLLMYLIWAVALVPRSVDNDLAMSFIEIHAKIVLPFLVGMTLINSVQQLKQLAWVIALSNGYLAYDFNNSFYEGFNRLQELGFGGMDNNTVAITLDAAIGLIIFLGLHCVGWWRKCLLFGSGTLAINAIMFSFSRGGLLSLILTGAVAFLLIRKQPKHYLALIAVVLIGARLAGPQVLERFATSFVDEKERDRSSQLRVLHWKAIGDYMQREPWGAGPNQWRFVSPTYGLPGMEAHSHWLQTGAELGVPGLLALLGFFGLCIVRLWPLARERIPVSDPWLIYLARMVVASLAGFIFSAQFVSVQGVEIPFYIVLLGAGTLKLASVPASTSGFVPAAATVPLRLASTGWSRKPLLS